MRSPEKPMRARGRGLGARSAFAIVVALAATVGAVAPSPGTSTVSPGAADAIQGGLDAGLLLPADLAWEVEGPLLGVVEDGSPETSGLAGALNVNGVSFLVPVGVPIRVGDEPGAVISLRDVLTTPPGHENLVGSATVIATGTFELLTNATGTFVVYTADDVFLEKAENVLFGVVTSNGVGGLFLNGARVELERDPRFAAFVSVTDLAGRPLLLSDIPEGAFVAAEGHHDRTENVLQARIVEVDAVIPREATEADFVSVIRAEGRVDRGELRVRGFGNEPAATLTIFDYTGDVKGAALATGITVNPDDGLFEFRGLVAFVPPRILVESDFGGRAEADVALR